MKRRWYCATAACPRKSFTEQVAQVARAITVDSPIAAGGRGSSRRRWAHDRASRPRSSGVSWPVVAEAFTVHANRVLPAEPEPVAVLGIDEVCRRMTLTHRGRRGRGNDPEWRLRNRLTPSAPRMSSKHVDRLADTLQHLSAKIGSRS